MGILMARELLQKTELPEQESGPWRIERFTVSKEKADSFNLHLMFSGQGARRVEPGTYTRLIHEDCSEPMMSDTPAEMRDHMEAVYAAKGHCLIMGLGLGVVTEACLRKPEVDFVTVIELDPDIIGMVEPYLIDRWGDDRLEIIQADALEWRPPKDARYGMAWFDIWPTICEDNLDDMKLLTRRFGRKADWKGSWAREWIRW